MSVSSPDLAKIMQNSIKKSQIRDLAEKASEVLKTSDDIRDFVDQLNAESFNLLCDIFNE